MAIVKIMKFSREEEVVANCLKIIRYCVREENVSLLITTLINFPIAPTKDDPGIPRHD